jgi:anti-anti-sigma factor
MRLKIIRADDSITHLALIGRLDIGGVNDIQYEFLCQTTTLPKRTIVDLSAVSFVASIGISMLVAAAKTMERQRGVKMVLLNPTESVRKAIETSGLHGLIPIATAEMAAMQLLE